MIALQTSLYEDLVDATITTTQGIPEMIARTGRINLTRREINMQIGELFILRINIHLQGSVLDAPELMWAEPQLEPVYQAVRSYLEMDQRVALLQERVSVIADLLAVLKDQLTHTHGKSICLNPRVSPTREANLTIPQVNTWNGLLSCSSLLRSLLPASTSSWICTLGSNVCSASAEYRRNISLIYIQKSMGLFGSDTHSGTVAHVPASCNNILFLQGRAGLVVQCSNSWCDAFSRLSYG